MKQAKKWLMSLALIFQVMGCQARLTPEQIVDAFFQAYRQQDQHRVDELTHDSIDIGDFASLDGLVENWEDPWIEQEIQKFKEMFYGFEYTLQANEENGSSARVKVDFLTYALGEQLLPAVSQMLLSAFQRTFVGDIEQEKINQDTTRILLKHFNQSQKTYRKSFWIYSSLDEDGFWFIDMENNNELADALS